MGYIDDDSMVRVDFFKPSGKWYCTEAVKWTGEYHGAPIYTSFKKSLQDHFQDNPNRLDGMVAVCLEPYHEHAHPLMLKNWSSTNEPKRTFELRGVELPCPVDWRESSNGDVAVIDREIFWFKNKMDADLVRDTLSKIFTEARDKP